MGGCSDSADGNFVVGQEKELVQAHRALLVSRSEYFDKMLNSMFREGRRLCEDIQMPDVNPTAFRAMLKFLYANLLDVTSDVVIDVAQLADQYNLTTLSA